MLKLTWRSCFVRYLFNSCFCSYRFIIVFFLLSAHSKIDRGTHSDTFVPYFPPYSLCIAWMAEVNANALPCYRSEEIKNIKYKIFTSGNRIDILLRYSHTLVPHYPSITVKKSLLWVYFSYFHNILSYGILLWGNAKDWWKYTYAFKLR